MRINCTIDDTNCTLNVNANKPLNKILEENVETFAANNICLGAECGNCIVLINGECSLSCLVPAFKLQGANILTYEGFSKTRSCHDIERAYKETGINPCRQCFASKTILIESILQKLDDQKEDNSQRKKNNTAITSDIIAKELNLNACKCLDSSQLSKVVVLAYQYRSKRRGKA